MFQFKRHHDLTGLHAPFSPSQSSWLRYSDEKMLEVFENKRAAEMGSKLHEWAKQTIDLRIKQPRSNKTLSAYVNDAIGFEMDTEVVLFYSPRFFGTADAISFRKNCLRIHDLKTGKTKADIEQLMVYAALFCLEYQIRPEKLEDIELRIYQNDEVIVHKPTNEDITQIMKIIIRFDKILETKMSEEA